MLTLIVIYLLLGALAGLIGGMLGIGGGLVVVPILVFTLHFGGIQHEVMHLALGTSFSTIIFTSISSMRGHHRRGGVLWEVARAMGPGVVLGMLAGSIFAARLRTDYLQIIFVIYLFYVTISILRGGRRQAGRELPGKPVLFGVSGGIGILSSMVGIGGGTMIVPFLSWCNVPLPKAMGTSAALGLPIAITGTVMYAITGWGLPDLPNYTLGYIYLPAMLGISAASIFTAPLGSALTHRLPVPMLRKIFALMLLATGARMLWLVLEPLLGA